MKKLNKLLKHFFIPHRGNAYRPHALRHQALSIYSLGLLLSQLFFGITYYSGPEILGADTIATEKNIITYSNFERRDASLTPLYENQTLNEAASLKLRDMFQKNYWDHEGPNGETAWQFIDQTNYQYSLAGENLARGFSKSEEAVAAWMKSPTHRANILNPRFKEIGVAVGTGKVNGVTTTVMIQLFGEPITAFAAAKEGGKVLGDTKLIPELSLKNATLPAKVPYFITWIIIFALIIIDGVMIRRLGLHASKSHLFNFRTSLVASAFGLALLALGIVAIA